MVEYLSRYNEQQRRRHEVRPGLSGLAQVNGRNAISWEDKFKYDVQYVDHVTFLGDWKIIFQTVLNVIKRDWEKNAYRSYSFKFRFFYDFLCI